VRANALPGYPIEEHFGSNRTVSAFLPAALYGDYLRGFARHFGIDSHVRLGMAVTSLRFDGDKSRFHVSLSAVLSAARGGDAAPATTHEEWFDFVIVASGREATRTYQPPMIDGFSGEQIHSHHWEGPRHATGRTVVVVGARDAADDAAAMFLKWGAKAVVMSIRADDMLADTRRRSPEGLPSRSCPVHCPLYGGLTLRPPILAARGRSVYFADGTRAENDKRATKRAAKPQPLRGKALGTITNMSAPIKASA